MRFSCISYTGHDHLQSILTMSVCWPHPLLCWSPLYTDHFTKLTIICMYLKFVSCHIWLQGNMQIYLSVDFIVNKQNRNWIKSFLSGRSQKVVIDGEESKSVPVTSGVPQGSVLGPILFLIFIDDMPEYTKHSQIRLFADDTIVYLTVSATNDCEKLQDDLKRLEKMGRRLANGVSSCKMQCSAHHKEEKQDHFPIYSTRTCP